MRNVKNKIKFLIREASKSFGKELKSVVLFGSACFKKNPRDVDLIFVFEDDVPLGKRRLEIKNI
jgi:predicted nucleotidyltransferase